MDGYPERDFMENPVADACYLEYNEHKRLQEMWNQHADNNAELVVTDEMWNSQPGKFDYSDVHPYEQLTSPTRVNGMQGHFDKNGNKTIMHIRGKYLCASSRNTLV